MLFNKYHSDQSIIGFKNFHHDCLAATFYARDIDYQSLPFQGGKGRIAFFPETKTGKEPQNQLVSHKFFNSVLDCIVHLYEV